VGQLLKNHRKKRSRLRQLHQNTLAFLREERGITGLEYAALGVIIALGILIVLRILTRTGT
jgi:hypothetical protein